MFAPVRALGYPFAQDRDLVLRQRLMFIGHALFGVVERKPSDHLAVIGIAGYDGRLTGFRLRERLLLEKQAKASFGPDAAMTGDTFPVDDRFYLGVEVDLVL